MAVTADEAEHLPRAPDDLDGGIEVADPGVVVAEFHPVDLGFRTERGQDRQVGVRPQGDHRELHILIQCGGVGAVTERDLGIHQVVADADGTTDQVEVEQLQIGFDVEVGEIERAVDVAGERLAPEVDAAGGERAVGTDDKTTGMDREQDRQLGTDLQAEAGFGLEVSAKLPILFSVHAGGFVVGTDGSFTTGGVDFGGETFTGNVDSSLDFTDLYIEADLQLLDLDLVGCAIGVGYHLMNTEVSLSDGTNSAALDEDVQFPVIALRAHANLPILASLGAEAKIHWMELSYDDTGVSYLDATIQIVWRPWEMLGFIGGYRHVIADLSFDDPAGVNADADVDLTLSGPFLGLTAQF